MACPPILAGMTICSAFLHCATPVGKKRRQFTIGNLLAGVGKAAVLLHLFGGAAHQVGGAQHPVRGGGVAMKIESHRRVSLLFGTCLEKAGKKAT